MGNQNCIDRYFIRESVNIYEKKLVNIYDKKEGTLCISDNELNLEVLHNESVHRYKIYFEGISEEHMEKSYEIFKERYGEMTNVISESKIKAVFFDKDGENINNYIISKLHDSIPETIPGVEVFEVAGKIQSEEWIIMEE